MFFSSSALLCPFCAPPHPCFLCAFSFASLSCCFSPLLPLYFFFFEERRQTCCLFFFLFFFSLFYICQAGKRDVGRDCSAKSAAAERERKLLMNERQSFGVARCSWGHFTWMVSGCVRSSTAETAMLQCRRFCRRVVGFFFFRCAFSCF